MDAQGDLYHFIIQGIKRKAIFKEDDDESWGRPLKGDPGAQDFLTNAWSRRLEDINGWGSGVGPQQLIDMERIITNCAL
jgi:hypothetical protein